MRFTSYAHRSPAFLLTIATFAVPALMSLVVLAAHVPSLLDASGKLLSTSGGESISIYNIMKVQRGLTLYEDPRVPPNYPTTLYNAGFYQTYAWVTRAFRHDTGRLIPSVRFFTLAMACSGLAGLLAYAISGLRRRPSAVSARLTILMMVFAAVTVTLGAVPGWWLLTARPDVGAVACCGLALALALGLGTNREWTSGLSAGLCLALAWSFKQSCVFIFGGLLISALVQRRFRFGVALALPVVGLGIAFAASLGAAYRFNAFFATSLSSFEVRNLFHLGTRLALKGSFPLTAAIFALIALPHADWLRKDERTSLVACWWTTLIGGAVTCCRNGSELNYFFELWVVVGFLAVILARLMTERPEAHQWRPSRWAALLLAAVALCTTSADAACLLGAGRFGSVRLAMSAEQRAELETAKALAVRAEGAVFCQPALTGLAWDLPFPAYVFDDYPYFHTPALRRGLLQGQGLPGLIAEHHFDVMILQRDDQALLEAAVNAGYRRQPQWSQFAVFTAPKANVFEMVSRSGKGFPIRNHAR